MPTKRKVRRIGAVEQSLIDILVSKIRAYRLFWEMRHQGETKFNDRLMDYLRQGNDSLPVSNKAIPSILFFGEKFRPEFYLGKGNNKRLCAVECKRFIGKNVKAGFKAGLTQSLVYCTHYKFVVLVLFDFTKQGLVTTKLGPGNKIESSLARQLRKRNNIRIVALRPHDH